MTEKELNKFGFYSTGSHINQIHKKEVDEMDLGWLGLKVNLKSLTPSELVHKIYNRGKEVGYKQGANSIKKAINDILKDEE